MAGISNTKEFVNLLKLERIGQANPCRIGKTQTPKEMISISHLLKTRNTFTPTNVMQQTHDKHRFRLGMPNPFGNVFGCQSHIPRVRNSGSRIECICLEKQLFRLLETWNVIFSSTFSAQAGHSCSRLGRKFRVEVWQCHARDDLGRCLVQIEAA